MDKITITGIEFFAYHGVLQSEKEIGQRFIVDCDAYIDTTCSNDDIENTVNYAALTGEIVFFSTRNRFDLLESLADNLAKQLLIKHPGIAKLDITVHKPNAPIAQIFSDVSVSASRGWTTCYLALGSNLGDRAVNLDFACKAMSECDEIELIAKSDYIDTKPYGVTDQPDFLNGAAKIKTVFTPTELLAFCKEIEKAAGRTETRPWGERTLDIDILMYGDEVIFTDNLKIPHPEMHIRDFVLKPLTQIEPYLVHPIKGENVTELLKKLGGAQP